MATFTLLEDSDLEAIAAGFDLGAVRACTPIPGGTINSNFSLRADAGRFALRINEGKSLEDVRYEAAVVDALARAGVPAPRPRPARTGEPYLVHGTHIISLFPWIAGEHREPPALGAAGVEEVGRALARLHTAGLAVAAGLRRESRYALEHIAARAAAVVGAQARAPDPALAPALRMAEDEIERQRAWAPLRAQAPHGIIHGDLFPDNVLFDGAGIAALIDFEQASTGSLVYDLAVCLNAWCVTGDIEPALVRALMAGYRSTRPLGRPEVQALPIEVRAAALRFMVTRITDVYLAGEAKPDKDFRDYLRRLQRWREIGPERLLRWADLGE